MISRTPHRACLFSLLLVLTLTGYLFSFSVHEARADAVPGGRVARVRRVIDGDTIVIGTGEHVRYIGIDTPEQGEEFFEEARQMNMALLKAGQVEIVECRGEKKDKYGRTLAWVYAGGRLVNGELLSMGLARLLLIPPCGLEKSTLLARLVWQARSSGKGLWSDEGGAGKALIVSPEEAGRHIGKMVTVRGPVRGVRERARATFVEFGHGAKRGFTAVIFSKALPAFQEAGMEPSRFSGRMLSVTGVVRRYKGKAEIILVDPGQVRLGARSEAP